MFLLHIKVLCNKRQKQAGRPPDSTMATSTSTTLLRLSYFFLRLDNKKKPNYIVLPPSLLRHPQKLYTLYLSN